MSQLEEMSLVNLANSHSYMISGMIFPTFQQQCYAGFQKKRNLKVVLNTANRDENGAQRKQRLMIDMFQDIGVNVQTIRTTSVMLMKVLKHPLLKFLFNAFMI